MCDRNALEREKEKKKKDNLKKTLYTDSSSWSVTGLSTKCQNPGEGRVTLR